MTTSPNPAQLQTLRECQFRSAEEQRLLSGRGWLLVSALVQLISALHPISQYVMTTVTRATDRDPRPLLWLVVSMVATTVLFLGLWGWAKFAPFRAAVIALVAYVALHTGIALAAPHAVLDGIASKIFILIGLVMAVRTGYLRHRAQ